MKEKQIILLNGEEYVVGSMTALTIGLDDDCLPVVCPAVIMVWDEENNYLEDEGMRMPIRTTCADGHLMDASKLFWVSNRENYRMLTKRCEEERAKYKAEVEAQLNGLA